MAWTRARRSIVPSPQRQAAIRAAWVQAQRDAGLTWWNTPRILTFGQFAERLLQDQWARANLPDRLLPAGAEWACIRELRREAGGAAEARALLNSVRTLSDWRIAGFAARARTLAGIRTAHRSAGRARAPVRRAGSQAHARLARRAAAAAGKTAGRRRCQSADCCAGHTAPAGRAGGFTRFRNRRRRRAGLHRNRSERRARARTDRLVVPHRARTGSRTAAAHRRCEASTASRPVRTPAVADAGAVRVGRARGTQRFDGVRDRRRPAAGRVPAHRPRIAHLAPADRAIAVRRGRALVANAISRRRRCHGGRRRRSDACAKDRRLEFTGEELADVARTRDRCRDRRTRGAPPRGADDAGGRAPHAGRVVATPARRASTVGLARRARVAQ